MAETCITKLIETLASGYEMLLQQSQQIVTADAVKKGTKGIRNENQKETGYIGVKVLQCER